MANNINCPVCEAEAEDITVETFDGKTVRCRSSGDYDISGTVFDPDLLKRLDRDARYSALQRAKSAASEGNRPMILSFNL
ncbi:hypothetical protein [Bradyrhizobium sp. BWA-3-5]|uniref:hypothetical protein n=1 Tax=Bradyrhizobium sp. BWA-3-5 TaxID=3080013 RepID=UPI00293F6F8E|nr:hypothetical protein [Bradyrhizobium sp. BWA-3-5]WOH64054.1 hypothetical protein RX331_26015 [Bradyrhizobium sp. BWA-3-5]WOH64180.1 hypothetical protein RX331_26805 [Bradyrhizobium sp. BWA-3-5]WOH70104.1 hypothetical protein RX331_37950 [Bradyrhizobium sp. BWA-3-5]